MNGTTHVIVPATVTDIGDGPYFYASCQQCYSKLIQVANAYSCLKCRNDVQPDKVTFRYRLTMTLTDSSTFVIVTAFGGMLNAFFGCSASEFCSRWVKTLQSLVGNLEHSVMKWAVEETFVGSHLHFGFKIPSSFFREQKKQRNARISLKDIQAQSCNHKSLSSQVDKSLVATQIITQNDSQFPVPVTHVFQNVISAFENLKDIGNVTDSVWLQVRHSFRMKYARHRQFISSQTSHFSQDSVQDVQDYTSEISSLDQTSVAFSCSDACQSLGLSDRVNLEASVRGMESTTTAIESVISSDKNSHRCKSKAFSFVDAMSSLSISNVKEFVRKCDGRIENNIDDQNSVSLFENSDTLFDEEQEVPLKDIDMTQSLRSGLLEEKDISGIQDEKITELSSEYFNLNFNFSELKDDLNEYNISLPPCQPVDCGLNPDPHSGSEQLVLHEDYELPMISKENCETQNEHNKYTRFSSFKKLRTRRHSSLRTSSIKSREAYSELLDKNAWNSLPPDQVVNQYSFLDMPESEDLDVFLAAVNDSTTHSEINKSNYKDSMNRQAELVYRKSKSTETGSFENHERLEMMPSYVSHNGKDELQDRTKPQKYFIDGDSKKYFTHVDMVSEHPQMEESSNNMMKNFYDTDSALKSDGSYCASGSNLSFEDQNPSQSNISCDLFSSQESTGSAASHVFKKLSTAAKIIPSSDTSRTVKTMPYLTPPDDVNKHVILSSQDQSYDLFSTPSSKTSEEDISFHFNHLKTHSYKFNPACDSFDLFSSEEEI